MHSDSARIEITQPRLFTAGAVAVVNAYGLALGAPIFSSIMAVSVIKFGALTVLIPLLAVAVTVFFLPFGMGNAHITRLVRSLNPAAGKSEDGFIVQLTLSPRLRSGLRALLEDADDIGYLTFSGNELRFQGDSVKLSVPWEAIQLVRPRNIGWRGLFVYGRRIKTSGFGLAGSRIVRDCRTLLLAAASLASHNQKVVRAAFDERSLEDDLAGGLRLASLAPLPRRRSTGSSRTVGEPGSRGSRRSLWNHPLPKEKGRPNPPKGPPPPKPTTMKQGPALHSKQPAPCSSMNTALG